MDINRRHYGSDDPSADEPSYLRRPEHRHSPYEEDRTLKVRNILNTIFMLTAIVGIILFMTSTTVIVSLPLGGVAFDVTWGGALILIAIAIKIVEATLRLLK